MILDSGLLYLGHPVVCVSCALCLCEFRVTSNVIFDREARSSYQLTVLCHDLGAPPLSSRTVLHVRITDENDVTPNFDRKLYHATIAENNHVGATVLQVYDNVAHDTDSGRLSVNHISTNIAVFCEFW